MKTISTYGYAKVNLVLDVVGVKDGYHMLDSLVTTIDLRDKATVRERKDNQINLFISDGLFSRQQVTENTAFKTARLFSETFKTRGADVTLKKNIPVGSGLGGSSADVVAVLRAMEKIYQTGQSLKPISDMLGSDSGYLLSGGYARLNGRGEQVFELDIDKVLNFVIIPVEGGVDTKICFNEFDKSPSFKQSDNVNRVIDALKEGFMLKDGCKNALLEPAIRINPQIKIALEELLSLSPITASMSGSGSSVFAIFETEELCLWAQSKLKKKYKKAFVSRSISRKEIEKYTFGINSLYN